MKFEVVNKSEILEVKRGQKPTNRIKELQKNIADFSKSFEADAVEYKDWKRRYRSKNSCAAALRHEIKNLGIMNVSVAVRGDRVFLIKTFVG